MRWLVLELDGHLNGEAVEDCQISKHPSDPVAMDYTIWQTYFFDLP